METQKNNQKKKLLSRFLPRGGSILVFTLFILLIMLVVSLSITSVTVKDLQSSNTTAKTAQAFQVADSAVEAITKNMIDNNYSSLNDLESNLGGTWDCDDSSGTAKLTGSISQIGSTNTVEVTFWDQDNNPIADCSSSDPARMKVVATHEGTTRAIEVAVAAGDRPIVCNKVMNSTPPQAGPNAPGRIIKFSDADCDGAVPPAGYIGAISKLNVCNGMVSFMVLDDSSECVGANVPNDCGPGVYYWSLSTACNFAQAQVVYIKE